MWPFKRKLKHRRLEVRRGIQTATGGWWERFRMSVGIVPMLLAWVLFIGAFGLDSWPLDPMTHRVGQFVPADIHARVPFEFTPDDLLREEQRRARATALTVLAWDDELVKGVVAALKAAPDRVDALLAPPESPDDSAATLTISAETAAAWRAMAVPERRTGYEASIDKLRAVLAADLVTVAAQDLTPERERKPFGVTVHYPTGPAKVDSAEALIELTETDKIAAEISQAVGVVDAGIRADVQRYLLAALTERPLYRKDDAATQREIDRMIASATIQVTRLYNKDDVLAERSLGRQDGKLGLSAKELERLIVEHEAYTRFQRQEHRWRLLVRGFCRAAMLMALTVALSIYVYRYRSRIVVNRWRGLAIVSLLLAGLAMAKGTVLGLHWNPHTAVLPVLVVTLVLIIAYDQRFALAVGLMFAMYVVLQLRGELSLYFSLATAVVASCMLLYEIRSRSRLLEVTCMVGLVVAVVTGTLDLTAGVPWTFVWVNAVLAGLMAVLVGLVIQAILPAIERAFNIATSMALLEWCDASRPLLKRLAMEAPGTYNHSLQLGTMCEAAAEAIGARGLLARVGAYYHDIGKINKPKYFGENQQGANAHEGLSPEMSMLIITGHVKDGMEMAREYGLPHVLHEFIASHHGTTVAQYFYHVATEQARNGDDSEPAESQFRYGGPRPRSKEAGILLFADASESSVRAMTDPTPTRIEGQVHTMVMRRLMDGQMDECDLTLREVHKIEESLVKSLCGIYHARVAYPKPADEKDAAPAEETPTAERPEPQGNPAS